VLEIYNQSVWGRGTGHISIRPAACLHLAYNNIMIIWIVCRLSSFVLLFLLLSSCLSPLGHCQSRPSTAAFIISDASARRCLFSQVGTNKWARQAHIGGSLSRRSTGQSGARGRPLAVCLVLFFPHCFPPLSGNLVHSLRFCEEARKATATSCNLRAPSAATAPTAATPPRQGQKGPPLRDDNSISRASPCHLSSGQADTSASRLVKSC